jgi:hypothetical protein
MMSDYCTLADVYPLIGSMGTLRDAVPAVEADPEAAPPVEAAAAIPATIPTATQGANIITSVSTEIDMHLQSKGYVLPVTDAETLVQLAGLCASGSAARILKSRYPSAKGTGSDGGALEIAREDYLAGLKLIDTKGLGAPMQEGNTSVNDGFRPRHESDDYRDPWDRHMYPWGPF